MERRSLTGIARERETRTNNAAPRQSHGWSAGLRPASRGSAKPAPTTPCPANLTAANPRIANRAESRGHGAPVSDRHRAGARNPHQQRRAPPISRCEPTHRQPRRTAGTWSAGLRPASRGSAKPAPTTPPPTNLTAANPRIANRAESRGHGAPVSDRHRAGARNPHQRRCATPISRWSAGLRPASRGSAKPAPTTLRHANLTVERRSPTGIARERETRTNDAAPRQSHGGAPVSDRHRAARETRTMATPISRLGAPVSDRHRAGARNLHRRRWPRQSHGLERRSLTGIARERETRTDDAAPTPVSDASRRETRQWPRQSHGWSAGGAPVSHDRL